MIAVRAALATMAESAAPDQPVAAPWQWISHATPAVAPACLFQFNDEPALRALGLFQEETDPARG